MNDNNNHTSDASGRSDNPGDLQEQELRDTKLNPPPEPHHTNLGHVTSVTQSTGTEQVIGTDTKGLRPKDDTPWSLEKKDGPVSGT